MLSLQPHNSSNLPTEKSKSVQVKLGQCRPAVSRWASGHASLMLEPAFLMMRLTAGHSAEGWWF